MDNGRSMIHAENFGVGLKLKKKIIPFSMIFYYQFILKIHFFSCCNIHVHVNLL